ncbi:MAG: rhodanese-like domain-containing protein [Daejeonella sp.]
MFNSFFKKNENDLDGYNFKKSFENTQNAVLMDVRTPDEFNSGTITGSTNIDFMSPDFQTKIQELDPDKTYFLFCRSGNRSGNAVKAMEGMRLKAYNLVGGIGAWPKK